MGQIQCFRGRHEESVASIERAMKLNPYHPESLWFYLGRALFHAGRPEEALAALAKLTRPKVSALAYSAAASVHLGDNESAKRFGGSLLRDEPSFDPERFVRRFPYERETDRDALIDALEAALADE